MFPLNVAAAGGTRELVNAFIVTAGEDQFNVGYNALLAYGNIVPSQLWPDDLNAGIFLVVSRKVGNPVEVIFQIGAGSNTDAVMREIEITGLWNGVLQTRTLLRTSANYTEAVGRPNWSWLTGIDRWTAGTTYDLTVRRT